MRVVWAFEIKPAPRAKYPIKMEDFPHYIPGVPGTEMPINMVSRSAARAALIDQYYAEALSERPNYVRSTSSSA